jgi:ketol-acid reductoisomerase
VLRVYRDDEGDLKQIADEPIAVIGYGIQGRAQALNLRDSGLKVFVGNRTDAYADRARQDGFEVLNIGEATSRARIVLLLVPDEVQPDVFAQQMHDRLAPGGALVVAHGFSLRYQLIEPPQHCDVMLLAPRLPGRYVRDRFVGGSGVPAYVDVAQDATGRAWPRLLALAKAIGSTRVGAIAVGFRTETELDLFSEQFTFPLIFRALEIAFEELVAAGYPAEAAVMDLHGSGELGQILIRAAEVGLYTMLQTDGSPACRYGVLTNRDAVVDEFGMRRNAQRIIERIRDGSFARELVDDQRAGHPKLSNLTAASHGLPMGAAERGLRALLEQLPKGDIRT